MRHPEDFSSYGDDFFSKLMKKPELFSKMKFSIDFGFLVGFRYILVVIGKIKTLSLRYLEMLRNDFAFFFR